MLNPSSNWGMFPGELFDLVHETDDHQFMRVLVVACDATDMTVLSSEGRIFQQPLESLQRKLARGELRLRRF